LCLFTMHILSTFGYSQYFFDSYYFLHFTYYSNHTLCHMVVYESHFFIRKWPGQSEYRYKWCYHAWPQGKCPCERLLLILVICFMITF